MPLIPNCCGFLSSGVPRFLHSEGTGGQLGLITWIGRRRIFGSPPILTSATAIRPHAVNEPNGVHSAIVSPPAAVSESSLMVSACLKILRPKEPVSSNRPWILWQLSVPVRHIRTVAKGPLRYLPYGPTHTVVPITLGGVVCAGAALDAAASAPSTAIIVRITTRSFIRSATPPRPAAASRAAMPGPTARPC